MVSLIIDDWEPEARDAFIGHLLGDGHLKRIPREAREYRAINMFGQSARQRGLLEATKKAIPDLGWSGIQLYTHDGHNMVRMQSHVSDAVDEIYPYVYRWDNNLAKYVKAITMPILERFTKGAFAWNMFDDGTLNRPDRWSPYYASFAVLDIRFELIERQMIVDRFCELGFMSAHLLEYRPIIQWDVPDTLSISNEMKALQECHLELRGVMGRTGKPKVLTEKEEERLSNRARSKQFRSLKIPLVLAMHDKGVCIRRISGNLGIPKSSVHRYIHMNDGVCIGDVIRHVEDATAIINGNA